jgi:hypothetical protein
MMVRMFVLFFPIFLCGTVSAQGQPKTIITGRITDAETGAPLENVIAFLANTPLGASSGRDGTFKIAQIPAGAFELVLSCVGYERRTVSYRTEKPESLYYDIQLTPRPVQTKEVEVLGERPGGMKPNLTMFFPKASGDAFCVYGTGLSVPIGMLFTDSALYMYSIEPILLDSEKYIRLWVLYENISENPCTFDPFVHVKLHMKGLKSSYRNILPDPPREIQRKISNEDAQAAAEEVIGKHIQLVGEQHRISLNEELRVLSKYMSADITLRKQLEHYRANDILRGPLSGISMDDILSRSVNDGILKPHIVYPGNSVHGFLYFPFPGMNWKTSTAHFEDAFAYQCEMEIQTPTGSRQIVFAAH